MHLNHKSSLRGWYVFHSKSKVFKLNCQSSVSLWEFKWMISIQYVKTGEKVEAKILNSVKNVLKQQLS